MFRDEVRPHWGWLSPTRSGRARRRLESDQKPIGWRLVGDLSAADAEPFQAWCLARKCSPGFKVRITCASIAGDQSADSPVTRAGGDLSSAGWPARLPTESGEPLPVSISGSRNSPRIFSRTRAASSGSKSSAAAFRLHAVSNRTARPVESPADPVFVPHSAEDIRPAPGSDVLIGRCEPGDRRRRPPRRCRTFRRP